MTSRVASLLGIIAVLVAMVARPAGAGNQPSGAVEFETVNERGGRQAVSLCTESHALLIGAGAYSAGWQALPGVAKDLDEVQVALEAQGFQVRRISDPSAFALRRAFSRFIKDFGRRPGARLLFYFAGHGHTLTLQYGDRMGYIVPVDAPLPSVDPGGFKEMALDMQEIEIYAKRIEARHALFLFDSCFSGSFFDLSRAAPECMSYKTCMPVRQFITSGSADETVPDRSIFREQFCAALQGPGGLTPGYLTGVELGELLQSRVINYSKGAQHPQYGKLRNPNLDKGDFVFVVPRATAPEGRVAPPVASAPDPTRAPDRTVNRAAAAESAKQDFAKAKRLEASSVLDAEEKVRAWRGWSQKHGEYASANLVAMAEERRRYWSERRARSKLTLDCGNGVSLAAVYISPGTFEMGSPVGEEGSYANNGPQHTVTLTRGFWMGETEVTQAQYEAVMGTRPAHYVGRDFPVESVTLAEAKSFCERLSSKLSSEAQGSGGSTPVRVVLPSEAQWEFACRAGTSTRFSSGNAEESVLPFAWCASNAGNTTQPVKSKSPNAWGLYDMHGNVWEWCNDWFASYGSESQSDPAGPSTGAAGVARGGAWRSPPGNVRSAGRNSHTAPGERSDAIGFRVAVVP